MSEPLVEIRGLSKSFGSIKALDGLSLTVPDGTVCGLLGPNGSGKTTAIRVLLGLSRPTDGSTELLGEAPGRPGFARAIHQTGSLIEGPVLYGRATARQNMRIQAATRGLDDRGTEIDELLELVGLSDRADSKARTYSLGMKQRLGLAITLIGDPQLVILDEPTNGLDPSGIAEIRELIKRLPDRGVTVLVSSHQLAEIQLMCDRVTIINRGRLIADGTMAEVLNGSGATESHRVGLTTGQVDTATATLVAAGYEVTDLAGDKLGVSGGPVEPGGGAGITRTLAEAGIYLDELTAQGADLEKVFLSLTGGESGDAG